LNNLIECDEKLREFFIDRSEIQGDLREIFLENVHLVLGEKQGRHSAIEQECSERKHDQYQKDDIDLAKIISSGDLFLLSYSKSDHVHFIKI